MDIASVNSEEKNAQRRVRRSQVEKMLKKSTEVSGSGTERTIPSVIQHAVFALFLDQVGEMRHDSVATFQHSVHFLPR